MSLSSENYKTILNCTGGTTYDFDFKVFAASGLEVILYTIATGLETVLTLTTHYTVSLLTETGGRVTTVANYASPGIYNIIVRRKQPLIQEIDYTQNDTLSTEVLEKQLDKIVMMIQGIKEAINRSILQDAAAILRLALPLPESNKILGWKLDASGLENKTMMDADAQAAAAASAAAAVASAAAAAASAAAALASLASIGINANTYASINAAVAAIGATKTTLIVSDAQTLAASLIIPSTLALKVMEGGSITKAAGFTLTVNGPFQAGLYQIFFGFSKGDITFARGTVEYVYPEWWGLTDYGDSISQAIASIKAVGGKVKIVSSGDITSPIDATRCYYGLVIEGISAGNGGGNTILNGKLAGVVFDCTGSVNITFRDLQVDGDATVPPSCAFLLARDSTGANAGSHNFFNVKNSVTSQFTVATVYNYGSEEESYYGCILCNYYAGAKTMVFTNNNIFALVSTYQTIFVGASSTCVHYIYGGSFYNEGGPGSDLFYLEQVSDLHIRGGFWICARPGISVGRSYIYVDTTHAATHMVCIDGIRGEPGLPPDYGIYLGDAAAACVSWSITNCQWDVGTKLIYAADAVTLYLFHIQNVWDVSSKGISVKLITYSRVNLGTAPFLLRAAGAMSHTYLSGIGGSITITGTATTSIIEDTNTGGLHTQGPMRFSNFGAGTATFDATGVISSVSDERLKIIEGDFFVGLPEILKLQPKLFKYNELSGLDTENIYAGLIAQDVMKYIPEAVGKDPRGYYTFNDRPIMAALINSIKELQKEIDELKVKNSISITEYKVVEVKNEDRIIKSKPLELDKK